MIKHDAKFYFSAPQGHHIEDGMMWFEICGPKFDRVGTQVGCGMRDSKQNWDVGLMWDLGRGTQVERGTQVGPGMWDSGGTFPRQNLVPGRTSSVAPEFLAPGPGS